MFGLPLYRSHKTQPLDRNFFRQFKAFYDSAEDDWRVCHSGQTLRIYDVASVFKIAFLKTAMIDNAVIDFRATGIFFLDRNKVTELDFLPSESTQQMKKEKIKIRRTTINNF